MGTKLTWKRKNESDQVISHCGRYWISWPDLVTSGCNLWHDDTGVKIDTFVTPALAKVAAQHHLDNLRSAWQVMLDGIQPLRRDDRVEDDGGPTAEDLGHAPGIAKWRLEDLVNRQIRDHDQLEGKTISGVLDGDDLRVVLLFTDGTFAIIDPEPENDGCGFCLDAWWVHDHEFVTRLAKYYPPLGDKPEQGTVYNWLQLFATN